MELFDEVCVGTCLNCGHDLHAGGMWSEQFGEGNLYHTRSHSLLCEPDRYTTSKKASLKGESVYVKGAPALPSFDEPSPFATLVVTHLDGTVVEYPQVRFATSPNEVDPIRIDGTTVRCEDNLQEITILGVRSFKMEHDL